MTRENIYMCVCEREREKDALTPVYKNRRWEPGVGKSNKCVKRVKSSCYSIYVHSSAFTYL